MFLHVTLYNQILLSMSFIKALGAKHAVSGSRVLNNKCINNAYDSLSEQDGCS